jgi:hypothetical protein
MSVEAEYVMFALVQLGTLVAFLATIRSDLSNLKGWVKDLASRHEETALKTAEVIGKVETLPCSRCGFVGFKS